MVPAKPQGYKFSPGSIVALRKRLGLSQGQMADRLGIAQNSLSRWETGATTPDAKSLAAIYSVGAEEGIMPSFFVKDAVKEPVQVRDTVLVYWDIQNLAPSHSNVADWDHLHQGRGTPPRSPSQQEAVQSILQPHPSTRYEPAREEGVASVGGPW